MCVINGRIITIYHTDVEIVLSNMNYVLVDCDGRLKGGLKRTITDSIQHCNFVTRNKNTKFQRNIFLRLTKRILKKIKRDKMLLFLLFFVPTVTTKHTGKKDDLSCNGLIFDHVYFDTEVLAENLGRPYNLVLHKFSGTLFFSHTIQKGTEVDFQIMWCNLNKRKCKEIKGVPGGYAIAYDPGNDDIYFGGHDGIYKYNFLTKSAEFFAEEGKSIWGLFVRKNFYYIEYPTQKLYVYDDDKFVQVAEATEIEVDNFFVSKQSDVYFSNKTALYKVERVSKSTILLNDEIGVRQIVEDSYGDIYFCGGTGIYVEDKPYQRIRKVADIENAFGMIFDEHDRVIYSDKYTIYRLLPSQKSVTCYEQQRSAPENEEKGFKEYLIS